MKLHLPLPLFRTLMGLFAIVAGASFTASGSVMKTQHATLLTYADFGQNMGRYVTGGNVNGLLAYIRQQEGGVLITYTDGTASNVLEHGMVDFSSVVQGGGGIGAGNLIAPNAYITAQHNGTFSPSFSAATVVGAGNDIRYQGIEYRNSKTMEIRSNSSMDIKITRLNKLVTDAAPAAVYSGSLTRDALYGQTVYHSGAGRQYVYNAEAEANWWQANPGTFISGGVTELDGADVGNTAYTVGTVVSVGDPALSPAAPLPYQPQDGDSGSPLFIWDAAAKQFAYVGSFSAVNSLEATGGNTTYSKAIFDPTAPGLLDNFNNTLNLVAGHHALRLTDMSVTAKSVSETIDGVTYTTTPYSTRLYDFSVNTRVGEDSGLTFSRLNLSSSSKPYTWAALNDEMNKDNWYHYGSEYMNLADQSVATSSSSLTWSELYATKNNCFVAADNDTYTIELTGIVDTGIGCTQFSKKEDVSTADFVLSPRYASAQLLTSGYIVDKDVTLHLQFTNPENYVREWRKVGEGTLSVEGEGNNWVLLNVGGEGKTVLDRTKGFAAYNVLANTGSTVVINGINQIARDFTFGNGGAVLDFNGNSMTWNNGAKVADDGFTIHALTQEALITNNATEKVILTVTNGGANFLGSFSDAGAGALEIDFNGTAWELNSIRTDLTHHAGSGLTVSGGDVTLAGMLTQHAAGTVEAGKTAAYSNADDWHYSDASMNVTVKDGATFELGSHALLTGKVTVENGGTYVMHEGVKHAQEYVEGGQVLEDTAKYSAFYGHKGDVELDGTLRVAFSEGTDATTTYGGNLSGAGALSVATGEGELRLSGDNSAFSGTRTVENGTVSFADAAAMGDHTHAWLVQEAGVLVMPDSDDFGMIDTASTGVIALSRDTQTQALASLDIGAAAGATVHYGTQSVSLESADGKWVLGGGGGKLVVDFLLEGDNQLILGNGHSTGTVLLTNTHNTFTGGVELRKGIRLECEDAAVFGGSQVHVGYGATTGIFGDAAHVGHASDGALVIDDFAAQDWDLTATPNLSLAADGEVTFSHALTVADGADYHLGGAGGTLTMAHALSGAHGLVVDGQGSEGGKIVLAEAATLTGAVTVQGYDADRATSGDVTLRLATDDSLATASSVTVRHSAHLDLNGTDQSLRQLSLGPGGAVIDSAAEQMGTLNLHGVLLQRSAENAEVLGAQGAALNLAAADKELAVTGAAGGQLSTGSLTIGEGHTLRLGADNLALRAAGAFVNQGALVVDSRTSLSAASFRTEGGTITARADFDLTGCRIFDGSTNRTAVNQLFAAAQSGTGSIILGNGAGWLSMDGDADITAHFSVTGGHLQLNSNATKNSSWHLKEGGRLDVTEGKLMLESTAHLSVEGGELNAAQGLVLGHADSGAHTGNLHLSSGSITTSGIELRAGGHNIEMTGGTLTVTGEQLFTGTGNGTINLAGGTLAATSTSWETNHDVTLGAVSLQTSADTTISFTGQTTLTATLHNAGNISFAADNGDTRLLSAEGDGWNLTHTYHDSVSGSTENGFVTSSVGMLVEGEAGSSVNLNGRETIRVNGADYALHTDGSSAWFTSDASTREYVVNSGTLHFGASDNEAQTAELIRLNGGVLALEKNLGGTGVTVSANRTVKVDIAGDVTLQAGSLSVGQDAAVQLAGSGEYALRSGTGTLTSGISLSDDWGGVVRISNYSKANVNVDINALGDLGTSVGLTGVSGWISQNGEVTAALNLKDDGDKAAFTFTDGFKGSNNTFAKAISGDGTLRHTKALQWADNYTFNGDISAWTGVLDNAVGPMGVVLTAASSVVNAEIRTGKTANLALTTKGAETIFNKVVNATSLSAEGNVTFNANASLGTLTENGHAVSLGKDTALTLTQAFESFNSEDVANKDSSATVNLTANGEAGSSLHLNMNNHMGWNYNNTICVLAEDGKKSVEDVYVSGYMAYDVYGGTAQTKLGSSNLHLTDASVLEIRKDHQTDGSNIHMTSGDIVLDGTVRMELYGSAKIGAELDSDIRTEAGTESTLRLTGGGGVTLAGEVTVNQLEVSAANGVKLKKTATMAGSYKVSAASETSAALLKGTVIGADGISGGSMTDASVSLLNQLSYTVENMQMLDASSLTVESGVVNATNSTLRNLVLGQQAAVHGSGVTVTGDCHVEVAAAPVALMTLAAESEETPIVLYSDQLSGVMVKDGATLTLDIDSILPQLTPTTTQYTLVFTDLTWETTGDIKSLITLQYGSWGTARELEFLSATHDADGTYLNLSIQAPEPATATLSLLALAGLAARRRRR